MTKALRTLNWSNRSVIDFEAHYPRILLTGYENFGYQGSSVGRRANRICKGKITIDGQTYQLSINNNDNHLHGGKRGWDKVLYALWGRARHHMTGCLYAEFFLFLTTVLYLFFYLLSFWILHFSLCYFFFHISRYMMAQVKRLLSDCSLCLSVTSWYFYLLDMSVNNKMHPRIRMDINDKFSLLLLRIENAVCTWTKTLWLINVFPPYSTFGRAVSMMEVWCFLAWVRMERKAIQEMYWPRFVD